MTKRSAKTSAREASLPAKPQDEATAVAGDEDSAPLAPTPYQVYMLLCEDGTVYTGITTDVVRRIREHRSGSQPGARYTRYHRPVELLALWDAPSRSVAGKLEYRIKQLARSDKDRLVAGSLDVADVLDAGSEQSDVAGIERVPDALLSELWEEALVGSDS